MIETPKNLTRNILLGLLFGFLVASFFYYSSFIPEELKNFVAQYIFSLGGDIFLNLLKLLVVPLVFFSLVSGISSLSDTSTLGPISLKTIGLYLLTTAIAVSTALMVGAIFQPGAGYAAAIPTSIESLPGGQSLYDTIVGIFPKNIFQAFVENQMLAIVFFSILFGIALNKTNHLTGNLSSAFEKLNTVFMQLVIMIMSFAPIGVFCLIGRFVITDGLDIFQDVFVYVALLISLLIFHALFTYSLFLKYLAKINPIAFFKKMKEPILFAFSTSSSAATIPVTLKTVSQDLGVDKNVASFVVPVGATINMDGTALYQAVAAVFIAQTLNMSLDVGAQLTIVLTTVLASIGTAAVPGAGIVMLVIILEAVGVPSAGIALILGVDRILDMVRTTINVTGDATVAVIIADSENQLKSPKN